MSPLPGEQITSLFPIAISALCPALGAKIFFFRFSEFCALLSPFHSDCRGALRVVTNAERNAVDADLLSDERHRGGRRNRVVLPKAGAQVPAKLKSFAKGDGGNRQGSPGRSRISRKTTAQGRPV
jgi:hypothetical protein